MLALNARKSAEESGVIVIEIPMRTRILPGTFAALFILGILVSIFGGAPPFSSWHLVPAIIALLCALGALYNERWVFDRTRQVLRRQVGLLFVYATRNFPFAEIARLSLGGLYIPASSQRTRGVGKEDNPVPSWRSYVTFDMEDTKGRRYRIEQARGRRTAEVRAIAGRIGAMTGLPLNDRVRHAGKREGRKPS